MKESIFLDWAKAFDEALGFAKALCKLGYGTLIVPQPDGRCLIFYQPKR